MVETLEDATQYCVDVIDEMLESAYEDAREEVQNYVKKKDMITRHLLIL